MMMIGWLSGLAAIAQAQPAQAPPRVLPPASFPLRRQPPPALGLFDIVVTTPIMAPTPPAIGPTPQQR
jgi:hypothetical protein